MRSVQLFPSMNPRRLTAVLEGMGEHSGTEWFGVADGRLEGAVQEYRSTDDLLRAVEDEGSFTGREIDALRRLPGDLGTTWVEVRLSGLADCQAAMQAVAHRLLVEGGYGFDDHSDHAWSASEVLHGRPTGESFRA